MNLCVLGDEEEAAEEEDEEELQLPALDGLSSSPGKTGLCGVDAGSLSPGEDADTKGEGEKWATLTPTSVDKGLDLLQQSLIIAVSGGNCKTDLRSALRRGKTTPKRAVPREILRGRQMYLGANKGTCNIVPVLLQAG